MPIGLQPREFRVGEIAAWHAGIASMILIYFSTVKKDLLLRLGIAVLIGLLIGAIMLTGRRKMLMALVVFLACYGVILAYFWHGVGKIVAAVIVVAIAGGAFAAFQESVSKEVDSEDFRTHYDLGIAYKEMGLFDEAIREFQHAGRSRDRFLDCCAMLALLFREKGMPDQAEEWYRRGLEAEGFLEGDYVGLRYELAELCAERGGWQLYRVKARASGSLPGSKSGVAAAPEWEAYLQERATPTELLPLLALRPIAGGQQVGQGLLEAMAPTLCRRYDRGTVTEAVGGNRGPRVSNAIESGSFSFDVERGEGGLRDIELLTRGLQLLQYLAADSVL